jgi:protein-S-isoprenylcysteine O-methyltransferase Ste14
MDAHPAFAFALRLVWLAVVAYWFWGARGVKAAVRTEAPLRRLVLYVLPLVIALLLLGPGKWFDHSVLRERFISHSVAVESIGLSLCVFGAVIACSARHTLGRNWSGTVQLKEDHELIERGLYRYVRHPIYTGFLMLFLGNAIMVGDWRGLLAVAIVFVSFWRKLKLEELWLTQLFGARYTEYANRTKALIPGVL